VLHPLLPNAAVRTARLALGLLLALPAAAAAQTYDVSTGFSGTSNPSGPWQYGFTNGLGGAFTLFTTSTTSGPLQYWGGTPGVYKNTSASAYSPGTPIYPAGQVGLHPGPNGEYAVIRFVAPIAGSYTLSGNFEGLDTRGTTTDAHIRVANVDVFATLVNGYAVQSPFLLALSLGANDIVDFAVGANGDYFFDTTALDATFTVNATGPISSVPEPGTWALMGTGLLGVAGIARRRRHA
jgi:hypothetical protein